MADAVYSIVRDQGGNIGLLCPVCGQARWTPSHEIKDWATQADCPNCSLLRENHDVEKEHQKERLFKKAQEEQAKAKEAIDAANTAKKKEIEKAKVFQKASDELAAEQGLTDELAELKA